MPDPSFKPRDLTRRKFEIFLKLQMADPRNLMAVLHFEGIEPHPGPTTRGDLRKAAAMQHARSVQVSTLPSDEPAYCSPIRMSRLNQVAPSYSPSPWMRYVTAGRAKQDTTERTVLRLEPLLRFGDKQEGVHTEAIPSDTDFTDKQEQDHGCSSCNVASARAYTTLAATLTQPGLAQPSATPTTSALSTTSSSSTSAPPANVDTTMPSPHSQSPDDRDQVTHASGLHFALLGLPKADGRIQAAAIATYPNPESTMLRTNHTQVTQYVINELSSNDGQSSLVTAASKRKIYSDQLTEAYDDTDAEESLSIPDSVISNPVSNHWDPPFVSAATHSNLRNEQLLSKKQHR